MPACKTDVKPNLMMMMNVSFYQSTSFFIVTLNETVYYFHECLKLQILVSYLVNFFKICIALTEISSNKM